MASDSNTKTAQKTHRTICLPFYDEEYGKIIDDAAQFRHFLDCIYEKMPELFPPNFLQGYQLKDSRMSKKLNIKIRRIELKDNSSYSIRPSFVMPYMTAYTQQVENPLFFRKFGVPFWALAHVFGRNPMYWYRLEVGLGRNSVVGTTVRTVKVPKHLLAD